MAQTILNYPPSLITRYGVNNITISEDSITSDYEYFTYILYDRKDITYTEAYTTGDNNAYTMLTCDTDGFEVGEIVYLLDESVSQEYKSGSYQIIAKPVFNKLVINRLVNTINQVPSDLTINHSVGYSKFPDYRDNTGTFIIDKNLFDFRIKSLQNGYVLNNGFKSFYTVTTYSSKKDLDSLDIDGLIYEETTTGIEPPYVYITTDILNQPTKFSIGDAIKLDMANKSSINHLGYELEVVDGENIYKLKLISDAKLKVA